MTRATHSVLRELSGAAAAVISIACSPSRPMLSSAVHDVKGVDCPEERIQVLDTRSQDGDTVYVLDACGKQGW